MAPEIKERKQKCCGMMEERVIFIREEKGTGVRACQALPHPLSPFSHLAAFPAGGMQSQGTRARSRVVPKAPGSKSCSSKQEVALTKSLPAPGWGCRSRAGLGSPSGEDDDDRLCGVWGCQEHPLPREGHMPGARKGLESRWGLEDADKPLCSPLGFLLPAGAVAVPHLILV